MQRNSRGFLPATRRTLLRNCMLDSVVAKILSDEWKKNAFS